jgi:WD40 repeat protein
MALAFVGDGKLVSGDRNGVVKVWDVKTRKEQSFQAHRDRISGLAGLPSGDGLLSASEDRELARWSLSSLPDPAVRWQQRSPMHALTLMPDGSAIVTAGADGRVRVWDIPAR